MATRKIFLLLVALCGFAMVSAELGALYFKASSAKDGRAAAPPDFQSCWDCHDSYAVGSGGGSMSIDGLGGLYTPGTTYPMTVTVSRSGSWRWGFEIVALDGAGNSVGTLTAVDSYTQVSVSGGFSYLKQTFAGTFNGSGTSVTWNFQWTAPAAGAGTVRFYGSSVACDGNYGASGDYVYNTAVAATEGPGEVSVTLQPGEPDPTAGGTWDVPVFLTNNSGAADSLYLVSRINLGGGNFYPSSGWLTGPTLVDVPAGSNVEQVLSHSLAPTTPLITATYEALIGRPPGTLVDMDSFVFTVRP